MLWEAGEGWDGSSSVGNNCYKKQENDLLIVAEPKEHNEFEQSAQFLGNT